MMNDFPTYCGTALLMGLISGTSYCTAGCAPFLSTYVMGTGRRIRDGMWFYCFFSLGRILTYSLLGMASVRTGRVLSLPSEGLFASYFSGVILFLLGVILFIKQPCPDRSCKKMTVIAGLTPRNLVFNAPMHLFLTGAVFAAMPCPPLLGMMTYSLQLPSILSGSIVMFLFGLGTLMSPLIVIACLSGFFAKKIRNKAPLHIKLFHRAAGVILMMMGGYMVIV